MTPKEKRNLNQRNCRSKNPEKRRVNELNYIKKHPEYKKAKDARYYKKHIDEIREKQRKYSSLHSIEATERIKKWRKENRDKANTINANRRARIAKSEGFHTTGEWELLKKQFGFRCVICKKSEPEIKLTRDHIIPISRGGSNWIENIQPLCAKCNSIKSAKMPNNTILSNIEI